MKVPSGPPVALPIVPEMAKFGTVAADIVALNKSSLDEVTQFRLEAMIERERLESNGFGDELMELQEASWPLQRIRDGDEPFCIDMLFEYPVDDGVVLSWCQGAVKRVVKEHKTSVVVEIEWDEDCVREGGARTTKQKLSKGNWNRQVHGNGTWREDLRHLSKSST